MAGKSLEAIRGQCKVVCRQSMLPQLGCGESTLHWCALLRPAPGGGGSGGRGAEQRLHRRLRTGAVRDRSAAKHSFRKQKTSRSPASLVWLGD